MSIAATNATSNQPYSQAEVTDALNQTMKDMLEALGYKQTHE